MKIIKEEIEEDKMKKIIRLTENDLTRIVKQVIKENSNQKYYSQRNLRRLGRTPIIMIESIEQYRPTVLNEGIFDSIKDKLSSALDSMTDFFKEKGEKMKNNVEDFFDKDIKSITLDDVKLKLKDELRTSDELNEEDKESLDDMIANADIGNEVLGEPVKDKSRITQRVLNFIQTIFGINMGSFGLIGTIIMKFFGMAIPMPISLVVSVIAISIIWIIRKIIAIIGKRKIKESFYRKYRRY